MEKESQSELELSVVIPVFNEEANLEPLIEELEGVLNKLGKSFEVICVDDKSIDNSLQVLKKLKEKKKFLRIIPHKINCGQSAASASGFINARGKIIITMDADMQNDPADIPLALESLKDDIAAVCGIRRKRKDTIVRKISSRIANGFRNIVTGDKIFDSGCAFRVIRRNALRQVPIFNGMHRFLPSLLRMQGYKVVEISVNHRPRTRGVSKYGIWNRLWRGIIDCFAMRWLKKRAIPGDRAGDEI